MPSSLCSLNASHGCGAVHPPGPPVKVSQTYATHGELRRRGLAVERDVAYGNSSFVPLSTLDAAGLSGNMRITVVWDVVTSGDVSFGQAHVCSSVGELIYVHDATSATTPTAGYSLSSTGCEAEQVVRGPAGAARFAAIQSRTQQAAEFFRAALRIRPILSGGITVAPSILAEFNLSAPLTVDNTDLIRELCLRDRVRCFGNTDPPIRAVIMTARPSPNLPIAGFATCMQSDQYGRCTVGWFNWCVQICVPYGTHSRVFNSPPLM